jgi:hypothetical protein
MTDKSLGLFDASSRDECRRNTPMNFAFEVALTFVLVAVVFLIYDIFVQNRNEKHSASESTAIVSSSCSLTSVKRPGSSRYYRYRLLLEGCYRIKHVKAANIKLFDGRFSSPSRFI